MASKFVLIVLILSVAMFSVAFAMPAVQPVTEEQAKETLQTAESANPHVEVGIGGYPGYYGRGYRGIVGVGGIGIGFDYGSHFYGSSYPYHPHHPYHY